jgi:predicted DNA-binding transcriptional regulator AlpA
MKHWSEFVDPNGPDGAFLSWRQVAARVGISRTTAWRLQKVGEFPKPYVVSAGRVAYRESEVEAWKASRGHRPADSPRSGQATPAEPRSTSATEAPTPARSLEPAHLPLTPAASVRPFQQPLASPATTAKAAKPTSRARRRPGVTMQLSLDL